MSYRIRWMITRDLAECSQIDAAGFDPAWSEEDFLAHTRQKNCIGVVAERKGLVVGYMLYELFNDYIQLVRVGVHPNMQLRGVGRSLMAKVCGKLSRSRRSKLKVEFPEADLLSTGEFFKACGFRGVGLKLDLWDGHNICMEYNAKVAVDEDDPAILSGDFTQRRAAA